MGDVKLKYRSNGKRSYKQEGPICGIYAFLNGIFPYSKQDVDHARCLAKNLWKNAIKDSVNITSNNLASSNIKYSLIGEFFDSKKL